MTTAIYSTSKFLDTCFALIESYGSKALNDVINEATYACATVTAEEIARAACYVRGLKTNNVNRQEAYDFFKELIDRVNYNTDELANSSRYARHGF